MKRIVVFLISSFWGFTTHAQDTTNLVRNPSFEEFSPYTHCIHFADTTIKPLRYWNSTNFYVKNEYPARPGIRLQYAGAYNQCPKASEMRKKAATQQIDGKSYVQVNYTPIYTMLPPRRMYGRIVEPARTHWHKQAYMYTELKRPLWPSKKYSLRFKLRHAYNSLAEKDTCRMTGIHFSFTNDAPKKANEMKNGFLLRTDTITLTPLDDHWTSTEIVFKPDSAYRFLSFGAIGGGHSGGNLCESYGIDDIHLTEYDPTPSKPEKVLKELALQIQFETAS
ncbi:MAG: hypothetical protein AAF740_02280, partial [Bacteroidota bacterium]